MCRWPPCATPSCVRRRQERDNVGPQQTGDFRDPPALEGVSGGGAGHRDRSGTLRERPVHARERFMPVPGPP
eukprot:8602323-Pyramimonas_sp.AAC.1